MKKNVTSSAIYGDPSESVDACDLFQGSLLGLQLAPAVLYGELSLPGLTEPALTELALLRQAVEYSMAQTGAFVSAPNTWTVEIARLPAPMFLLPACVPLLLRYHHSWRRRLAWLRLLQSQVEGLSAANIGAANVGLDDAALASFRQNLVQVALLGDLLEAIGTGLLPTSWLSWLRLRAAEYRRECFLSVQYETVLSAVGKACQFERSIDYAAHRAFATGVSSVMTRSESYVLAMRCLDRETAQLTERAAVGWLAGFVAGLLSGAYVGTSGVPVLWQLRLSTDSRDSRVYDGGALAGDLFMLWSGQRF